MKRVDGNYVGASVKPNIVCFQLIGSNMRDWASKSIIVCKNKLICSESGLLLKKQLAILQSG